jgi:hypothetical protein
MKTFTMIIAAAAILTAPLLSADLAFARRGADDPAGHVRGEGARHASLVIPQGLTQMADKGSDDGKGHDAGDDKGGKNNSNDDNGNGQEDRRVPGGSGCDSAQDKAEHAACRG